VLAGAPQPVTLDVSVAVLIARAIVDVSPDIVTDVPPPPAVGLHELAATAVVPVVNVTSDTPGRQFVHE